MSRSRRKTPIHAIAPFNSDNAWNKLASHTARRRLDQALKTDPAGDRYAGKRGNSSILPLCQRTASSGSAPGRQS